MSTLAKIYLKAWLEIFKKSHRIKKILTQPNKVQEEDF